MLTSVPQTHPPGDGWIDWCFYGGGPLGPYGPLVVEIWRKGWRDTQMIQPARLYPLFNGYGLMWRLPPGPRLEPEVRLLTKNPHQ